MQGNDIATHYGNHNVVILESVLYHEPDANAATMLGRRAAKTLRRWDYLADQWQLDDKLCTWLVWFARTYSVPFCVWSFLPIELYERLIPPVERICGEYIIEWDNFATTHEAYLRLVSSPHVMTVYDGDVDRVERYWHMRGKRVEKGMTP